MFASKKYTEEDETKMGTLDNVKNDDNVIEHVFFDDRLMNTITYEEMNPIVEPIHLFHSLLGEDDIQTQVPVDTHYYDEKDYQYHRHSSYPHVHQPLKSMEPRVLMEIKMRIKASKRTEERAAKAGVASSVPELLASTSDTRVLIDTTTKVSGPVLSLVRDTVSCTLPIQVRKKKKRKRRRSKKQEPFKPTLCKLSEESSSPLHNTAVDDVDDHSCDGILLSDRYDPIRSFYGVQSTIIVSDSPPSQSRLSFLDDIILTELIDVTDGESDDDSFPFYDGLDGGDNVVSSQRFLDITRCNEDLCDLMSSADICDVDHRCEVTDCERPVSMVAEDEGQSVSCHQSWSGATGPVIVQGQDSYHPRCHSHQHHHHHYHYHKEHYDKRDLEHRTFSGQDMRSLWQSKDHETLDEYESSLGDTIIEDMKDHRCYEIPALNKMRPRNRYFHSN